MSEQSGLVVCNTTPLINLAGMGQLELLGQLYESVTVPEQVREEYEAGREFTEPELSNLTWIRIVDVPEIDQRLPSNLGPGEAATISLATSSRCRAILLDETAARRVAGEWKLPVTGTFGVLLAAKQRRLITMVQPYLDRMLQQGRHISGDLYQRILDAADELPE